MTKSEFIGNTLMNLAIGDTVDFSATTKTTVYWAMADQRVFAGRLYKAKVNFETKELTVRRVK